MSEPFSPDVVRSMALAICKSRTCEGASCCQWPANMGRVNCNAKQGAYDDAARAAISALPGGEGPIRPVQSFKSSLCQCENPAIECGAAGCRCKLCGEPARTVGMDWKLSDDAKARITEIELHIVRPGDPRLDQIVGGPQPEKLTLADRVRRDCKLLFSPIEIELICSALTTPTPPVAESGVREALEWPEPKVTNPDIANPTGVPYLDCLIHRVLDAQQDINFYANETMSQPIADAAALMDEIETALRLAALTSPSNGEGKTTALDSKEGTGGAA